MVLRRGWEIFGNDQVGPEFTEQLGTRRRRAQKTPLVPPVQAGFYFEDGRCLGWRCFSSEKCRDRAAECLQWAELAPSSRVRDILLDVARTWTRRRMPRREGGRGPLASYFASAEFDHLPSSSIIPDILASRCPVREADHSA